MQQSVIKFGLTHSNCVTSYLPIDVNNTLVLGQFCVVVSNASGGLLVQRVMGSSI